MSYASSLMNGTASVQTYTETHEFVFTLNFTTTVSISISRGKSLWISEVKSSLRDFGEHAHACHHIIQKTIDLIGYRFTLTESDINQFPLVWTLLSAFVSRDMYTRVAKLCCNSYSDATLQFARKYELADMLEYLQPRSNLFELAPCDLSHKIVVKVTRSGAHTAAACELVLAKLPMSQSAVDACNNAMACAINCAMGKDVSKNITNLHLGGTTYHDAVFVYIAAFVESGHLPEIESVVHFKPDHEKLKSYTRA